MNWFTQLWRMYRPPTAEQLMQEQLHEAQRLLVVAEQGRDYADAVVRYHQACIARLESKLNSSAVVPMHADAARRARGGQ